MDLKMREREGESVRSNVGAVRETRILLFGFSPEPEPP